MTEKLVIVAIARIDSDTESVYPKQDSKGVWLFNLPQSAVDLTQQILSKITNNVKEHVHTVITCNASEDSFARQQCISSDDRIRPRDVLNALGVNATLAISEHVPNVNNIIKIDAHCASGVYALQLANTIVQEENKLVLIVGNDKSTAPYFVNMFRNIGALAQSPDRYHTPFNKERCGFAMGEGAAALAVATERTAKNLNLPVLAHVDSIGTKSIVSHPTSPSDPEKLKQFLMDVISTSKRDANEFAYWDAHATATPTGDEIEYKIFSEIFASKDVAISSFKSRVGHCMSASAIVEIVHGIEELQKNIIPPNYNLLDPIVDDYRIVATPRPTDKKTFIKTSFGFGGRNGAIVITVQ